LSHDLESAAMTVGGEPAPAPPEPSDPHQKHRAERFKRLKKSIVSSILVRPLSLLLQVITIPLFVHYLGKEGYGLWLAVGSIAVFLNMTNLGLTLGLNNKLIDCHVTGDQARARRYVSSMIFALLILA